MILFTKKLCEKCDYVKNHHDLNSLGVKVEELSDTNAEALAELAYYELVDEAEKMLPILVMNPDEKISGAVPISRFLSSLS